MLTWRELSKSLRKGNTGHNKQVTVVLQQHIISWAFQEMDFQMINRFYRIVG